MGQGMELPFVTPNGAKHACVPVCGAGDITQGCELSHWGDGLATNDSVVARRWNASSPLSARHSRRRYRMIRIRIATLAGSALVLATATLGAQGNRAGIPQGELPSAGLCRVWIDGVPANRQPRVTDCATARRTAPANSRIIYGNQSQGRVALDPRIGGVNGRIDPRADPRSPSYDPRFDPNSTLYDPRNGTNRDVRRDDSRYDRNGDNRRYDSRYDRERELQRQRELQRARELQRQRELQRERELQGQRERDGGQLQRQRDKELREREKAVRKNDKRWEKDRKHDGDHDSRPRN
jgi:hypothetical protein